MVVYNENHFPIYLSKNPQGDVLEIHGLIVLNQSYWECECNDDYVRPKTKETCNECDAHHEDCADAYEETVQRVIYKTIN